MCRADYVVGSTTERDSLIAQRDILRPGLSVYCIDDQKTYLLDSSLRHWITRPSTASSGSRVAVSLADYCSPGTSTITMAANVIGANQALRDLASVGGGRLRVPHGQWHFNGPLLCPNWSHIVIDGDGWDSSYLMIHGLSGGTFLDCTNANYGQVDYCSVKGLTIYGFGISGSTAIRQCNWESGSISVRIAGWTGEGSVGLDLRGRELVGIESYITADRPVVIRSNPADPSGRLGLDHYRFRRCTLYTADPAEYAVKIADNSDISLVSWEGCAVVSDGGGFDLTAAHDLVGLRWADVRHESAKGRSGMTGWGWDIGSTHRVTSLQWGNCRGTHQAWRLRGASHSQLIGCGYEGLAGVALDIDESCEIIDTIGFFSSGGSVGYGGLKRYAHGPVVSDGAGNYYAPTATYSTH